MTKKKAILYVVLSLYVITWIGAWITEYNIVKSQANASYQNAILEDHKQEATWKYSFKRIPRAFPDGPKYSVLCFPILPGILYMNSGQQIGPLWGHGSTRFVVYVGSRCIDIAPISSWIS